jgi:cysteine desulfurase/selenocysteine lyase
MIKQAHAVGAMFFVDAAQAAPHIAMDVQKIDCDFLAFSGHKIYGPTGIGVLYGKEALLNRMPPFQGGGDMIDRVTIQKTTYNQLPHKFEAGTPAIAEGIALASAIDFINELGLERIAKHEQELLHYATQKLMTIPSLKIIGTSEKKTSLCAFVIEGVHPQDLGILLDQQGMAVRTGHHCTQPIMDFFNINATTRASFACYNTKEEIDELVHAITKAREIL